MNRIERLLRAFGISLTVFFTALAGCGGGGGGIPFIPKMPQPSHTTVITSGTWTWTGGADTRSQKGVYGTKGASTVPGAREGAASRTDGSGNLWLFGGYGTDSTGAKGYLSDLWKFDGTNWIWVSGAINKDQASLYPAAPDPDTCDPGAFPGSRKNAISWVDADGKFWLFGGNGYDKIGDIGRLNDLWKFDPDSDCWTWVAGAEIRNQPGVYGTKGQAHPDNVPGARDGSVSWIDGSGNLWLFGGYGIDSVNLEGYLNDLWKFDGTNWTWVSGADTRNHSGNYGTRGQAGPNNVPGTRGYSASWIDASGNLWLFGGNGYDWTNPLGYLNDLWKFDPAASEWTWVSGADTRNQPGSYGTKGQADPGNVPGARYGPISRTDANGNLWLFGGKGYDKDGAADLLNDLWKFDGTNWTWVSGADIIIQHAVYGTKGQADPGNVPGARVYSVSWTDGSGHLRIFGGYGYDSSTWDELNDLWKFDGTNWTWVGGADTVDKKGAYGARGKTNVPGARKKSASCTDANGNLWLFGGNGYDSTGAYGILNDLWKFDGAGWTWVSGSDTKDQFAVYGTKGQANPGNVPGARDGAVTWIDASGNLWLFGGWGFVSAGPFGGLLNDLWKFDPAASEWTWVSGVNATYQTGAYGTRGQAGPNNVPGTRANAVSWTDSDGNFWLFGGSGYGAAAGEGYLNDLWKFDPAASEWTWVSGADATAQPGVYGAKGAADALNVPGSRIGAASWIDAIGNLWLFGGNGYDKDGALGFLNDLWMFDGANWTWMSGADIVEQPGVYGTKGAASSSGIPGSREGAASWIDANGKLWLFGGDGIDSAGAWGYLNDLWMFNGANWTWVSGADIVDQPGVYGTKGVADASNVPGARYYPACRTGASGDLLLFGGNGYDSTGVQGVLNDLWRFTPR